MSAPELEHIRAFLEKRASERIGARSLAAKLRQRSAHPIEVVVHDLSRTGFTVDWPHPMNAGDNVWLRLPGLAALPATVVWSSSFKIGCKFDHPLHEMVFQKLMKAAPQSDSTAPAR